MSRPIRNVAIIAHVDHGKTTLIDGFLRITRVFASHEDPGERVMDRLDLERERGITIKAKNASLWYREHKINIVDTPGHADFGGEVERTLLMVDGVLLLVDAAEGPLPQTRFVLQKALGRGLTPIVVINKVDRKDARVTEVLDEIYDLFIDLGVEEGQLDFPVIYASAKEQWAALSPEGPRGSLALILDAVLERVPPPEIGEGPLQVLICSIAYSPYLGMLGIGRLRAGTLRVHQQVTLAGKDGRLHPFKVSALRAYDGLTEIEAASLEAGDIAILAGIPNIDIGDSVCDPITPLPLPRVEVDPPTVAIFFSVNTSPLAGLDGAYLSSRQLGERLRSEARGNVALQVHPTDQPEVFEVRGRGELQLCVLAEWIRREGCEFMMSRPRILLKQEGDRLLEPVELLIVDLPESCTGVVTESLSKRRGQLQRIQHFSGGRTRLDFRIPSRGLIGYRSRFLTETRGEGLMSSLFAGYEPASNVVYTRANGAMVADRTGLATAYAISQLEIRGRVFVLPGTAVYEGMVVGEHNLRNDLNVNIVREKKMTNMRAAGRDENILLTPVTPPNLDDAVIWLDEGEWVEVTPHHVRLRKNYLRSVERSVVRR